MKHCWVYCTSAVIGYKPEIGNFEMYMDTSLIFWRLPEIRLSLYEYFLDPLNPTLEEITMFDLEFNCDIMSGIELIKLLSSKANYRI